jgi:hypothetical protein
MPDAPCVHCGRQPTANVELRSNTGMVLTRRLAVVTGPYCRDCGLALFRRHMDHTLLLGWWGVTSFFGNFVAVARNVRAWSALRRLTAPVGPPEQRPLDPGRPLVGRFGVWAVAAAVLVLALVLSNGGGQSAAERLQGRCIRVDTVDRKVVAVSCAGHHDGKVVDVVQRNELCPVGTTGVLYFGTDKNQRLCVDAEQ